MVYMSSRFAMSQLGLLGLIDYTDIDYAHYYLACRACCLLACLPINVQSICLLAR